MSGNKSNTSEVNTFEIVDKSTSKYTVFATAMAEEMHSVAQQVINTDRSFLKILVNDSLKPEEKLKNIRRNMLFVRNGKFAQSSIDKMVKEQINDLEGLDPEFVLETLTKTIEPASKLTTKLETIATTLKDDKLNTDEKLERIENLFL